MSHRTSTIGARILNALHDKLEQPEEACRIVRASIRKVGEDSPELAETVLDDLHLQLPYPTYACTLVRSEEHTSELQSLISTPYAVFCLKHKTEHQHQY